jgi:hypothetical protein
VQLRTISLAILLTSRSTPCHSMIALSQRQNGGQGTITVRPAVMQPDVQPTALPAPTSSNAGQSLRQAPLPRKLQSSARCRGSSFSHQTFAAILTLHCRCRQQRTDPQQMFRLHTRALAIAAVALQTLQQQVGHAAMHRELISPLIGSRCVTT